MQIFLVVCSENIEKRENLHKVNFTEKKHSKD